MDPKTLPDNAAAITPTLFIGHYLSLDHEKFIDAQHAVEAINEGKTVLVDNNTDALLVLVKLGVPIPDALEKIRLAVNVLSNDQLIEL
jgi:hypothetical protein